MNDGIVIVSAFVAFLSVCAVVFLWRKLKQSDQEKKAIRGQFQQLENKISGLQLEALESRLNPHLFKNILNSIQSHAYQTYFALDKLASVLDYILYESRSPFVTPREEIDFALNLIEINKIKISPLFELKIKVRVDETNPLLSQRLMAPLITIDLIENAFKHANLQSEDAFIAITFELKNDSFLLTVSNKISARQPIKKEHSGIGRKSLQQRLDILYGTNYSLQSFTESDVFIAHLKINLLEHKTKMLATG